MFLGHYAVAFAAKKPAPKVSLGTLVLAAQFADLLWPLLLLLGIERVRIEPGNTAFTPLDFADYPVSHSLVGSLGWAILLGAAYAIVRRELRSALVVSAVSFSHWFLDLLTHRPDLALVPGGVKVGLGLWNSVPATMLVELGLAAAGIVLYVRATVARDRAGRYGLWGLVLILVLIYLANIFGPPPPNVSSIAVAGNALWLFVAWAYWLERHRAPRPS
jgi:hypothetical protein